MPHPLETYRTLYATELAAADAVMQQQAQADTPLIADIITHIMASGGKRLRPILTILCAKLFGYTGPRHIPLAAAIEFFHTATLLHDDVVDESNLRRGKHTANAIWSNQASVLVGDFLLSRAFQLIAQDEDARTTHILSDASATIAQGEVAQMVYSTDITLDETRYQHIIHGKTAALFAAACETGAHIAGQSPPIVQALHDYGQLLGEGFQMVDDALDYFGSEAELGKQPGDDIREGKVTLPLILLRQEAGPSQHQAIEAAFTAQDITALQNFCQIHDIEAICQAKAQASITHAKACLTSLPNTVNADIQAALIAVADYVLIRQE